LYTYARPFYCGFSRSAACVRSSFMLNCSASNLTVVKEEGGEREKSEEKNSESSKFANVSDFHDFFLSSMLKWRLLVISRKHADRHQHFFPFLLLFSRRVNPFKFCISAPCHCRFSCLFPSELSTVRFSLSLIFR
jgi:hypothetical protein